MRHPAFSTPTLYEDAADGGREGRWICEIIMRRFHQKSKKSRQSHSMVFISFLCNP